MRIGLRELTFFLLLIGILGAAAYFVFMPHWQQTEYVRRDNLEKQARLSQLDRLGQTSENLAKDLGELSKALEFFESKLPTDQQIDSVLSEVTQITERHGLTTRSVRTLRQTDTAEYVAQPIEMDMSGAFESVYQFLLDLEKMPRITRVSAMELVKDKSAEGQVQTKMIVSVYFEPTNRPSFESSGAGFKPVISAPGPAAGGPRRTTPGGAR